MTLQSEPREPSSLPQAKDSRAARAAGAGVAPSRIPTREPEQIRNQLRDFAQTPLASLIKKAHPEDYESCLAEQRAARTYAERHLWPNVERWDQIAARDHSFAPWSAIDGALEHRFLSMSIPPMFGGRGVRALPMNVWAEEISAADAGMYVVFGSHALALSAMVGGFDLAGMGRICREITAGEKRGQAVLLALGYTEVGGGSDVEDVDEIKRGRIASRWRRVAGGFRLDARKVFISVGNLAKYVLVTAYADPKRPLETTAGFLVRNDTPGFSVGRLEHKMGQRICPAAEIICDDVFVDQAHAFTVTDGIRNIDTTLSLTRGPVGTMATGVIRGVIERTLAYLAEKRTGGRWLFEEQWVKLALADMIGALQAGRGLYMQAALSLETWGLPSMMPRRQLPLPLQTSETFVKVMTHPNASRRALEGYTKAVPIAQLQRVVADGSVAKFMCSDLAVRTCMKAMEILGEDANDPRWGVEKCMRDVKLAQIFEGTNEVNRLHVTRGLIPWS